MDAFATYEDLQSRWRVFSEDEIPIVETALLDASAYIAAEMARSHVTIDSSDEVQTQNLIKVTCAVVKRSLSPQLDSASGGFSAPVSKMSEQAGVFNASITYANPMGDYYLTAAEKRSLGIGRVLFSSVRAALVDLEADNVASA